MTTRGGGQLDVLVFDRDQPAAGAFYRLYRWARVRGQVSHGAPLSVDRAMERRALLAYAINDAGVLTPRLRTPVRVGPGAAALAYEHCAGTTLAQRNSGCTEAELGDVWDAVTRLHARDIAHRGLTADRIMFTADGQVMLLDPANGNVAASDLQNDWTLPSSSSKSRCRSVRRSQRRLPPRRSARTSCWPCFRCCSRWRSSVPPGTRCAARRAVLAAVRKSLLAAVPGGEVTPVQLERVRPRTLLTLVAGVAAVYLLAGELAQASLVKMLQSTDWRWGLAALALSALTYVGAALSVSGFVTERLSFVRTLLVQLASSFITLVTPAAVGGAALNVRYLQRRKIPAPAAVASVGVSQVVAFALHVLLLAVFAAIAGTGANDPLNPPSWAYFVVAGLVALACLALAVPASRRMLRARLSPTFGQVLPRLLEVAQRPRKLAEGIGGALLLNVTYILCLVACVAAFGGPLPVVKLTLVYLTGVTIGSVIPTPGGLGAVEAALTAGLIAAGVPSTVAVSAVLLFRLLTFWLPVPAGLGGIALPGAPSRTLTQARGADVVLRFKSFHPNGCVLILRQTCPTAGRRPPAGGGARAARARALRAWRSRRTRRPGPGGGPSAACPRPAAGRRGPGTRAASSLRDGRERASRSSAAGRAPQRSRDSLLTGPGRASPASPRRG